MIIFLMRLKKRTWRLRWLGKAVALLIAANISAMAASEPDSTPESGAIPVGTFLSSLGICIHYAQGVDIKSYIEPLRYLAVKNVRDDLGSPEGYVYLHKEVGVKADLIGSAQDLEVTLEKLRYVARQNALMAVEGPNEPNNFPITYEGQKGGGSGTADWTPVAKFQKDLYSAVKADVVLSKYPVFHTSEAGAESPNVGLQFLVIPTNQETTFPAGTKYADYANVHNYVSGTRHQLVVNQAWNAADPTLNTFWDGMYGEYAKLWNHGYSGYEISDLQNVPRVTTETGWDSESDAGGEELQGKMLLNTYLAQYKRGWRYTFIYMLRDGEGGLGNQGIYHADSTPKLAALYIHNLTTILSSSDDGFLSSKELFYKIQNSSNAIHSIMLQKSSTEYALVIWGERTSGSENITVNLPVEAASARVYDPTIGVDALTTHLHPASMNIVVSDHPIIVDIDLR